MLYKKQKIVDAFMNGKFIILIINLVLINNIFNFSLKI
jgi:hypothetical protein